MTMAEIMPPKTVRIPVEYATILLELLADVEADPGGQLPLLDGEHVGYRRLTNQERLAVDELKARTLRILRFR